MVTMQASTGSQNFWSTMPRIEFASIGISTGKGYASVPYSMAVTCWIISAKASVDST